MVKMEFMVPREVRAELDRSPIAYVPWGAMEWHGEHLPLGQDALKAERICVLTAKRTGGIVLPPIYIGHQTMQLYGMPFTLEFSRDLVKELAVELLRQLELMGFKVIVILCGHYGREHLNTIKEAVEEYAKGGGKAKVLAEPEYVFAEDMGYHGDHAAKWETSIFWYFYPEYTHMELLPKDLSVKPKGVVGEDPRAHASRELGEKVVELIVNKLADKVLAMLREG